MKKIFSKANLRKLRRIYAYIVGGGLTAFFAVYEIDIKLQNKILFWIGVGAIVIQALNDRSKEPLKTNPKI